jgi:GH24 family phage-related lysozyme (muramidase)
MDGLSGMRLFEGYSITEIFLPQNYRNNIKFITKGINHKIDGNGWVTSIDSLSIPKFEGDKTFKNAPIKKKSSSTTSTTDVKKAEKLLGGCKNQKSYKYTTPSSSDWKLLTAELIRRIEAGGKLTKSTIGTYDENAYRAGYGSSIVLRNGNPIKVQEGMVVTAAEAEDTLINYSIPKFSSQIINNLGQQNWDKLNNNQKAALISLAYNAGPAIFKVYSYGKNITAAISNNDLTLAGNLIYDEGPVRGEKSGYLTGLEKRRKEESILFLTPDNTLKTETFSIPGKRGGC